MTVLTSLSPPERFSTMRAVQDSGAEGAAGKGGGLEGGNDALKARDGGTPRARRRP
jgi:hypothetical protein